MIFQPADDRHWTQAFLSWRGRIALLLFILSFAIAIHLLNRHLLLTVTGRDRWEWTFTTFCFEAYSWLNIVIGPLWAVFEDRKTESPLRAAMRGYALSTFMVGLSASLPSILVRSYEYSFSSQWLNSLFVFAGAILWLALPLKVQTATPNSFRLPAWMIRTSGRFVVLTSIACVAMLVSQLVAYATFQLGLEYAQKHLALIQAVMLPYAIVKQSLGLLWAVGDDRTTVVCDHAGNLSHYGRAGARQRARNRSDVQEFSRRLFVKGPPGRIGRPHID